MRSTVFKGVLLLGLASGCTVDDPVEVGSVQQGIHDVKTIHVMPAPTQSCTITATDDYAECSSLTAAYGQIDINVVATYNIVVHDGTYSDSGIIWDKSFPDHWIIIKAADGETPIFDGWLNGERPKHFIRFHLYVNGPVNIRIQGLEIRNYANALWLKGEPTLEEDVCPVQMPEYWNEGFEIIGNVFHRIGDDFDNPNAPNRKCGSQAVILATSSRANVLWGNVFSDCLNVQDLANCTGITQVPVNQLHAFYAGGFSSDALIYGNFVTNADGDPFKFINDSSRPDIAFNYTHRGFREVPVKGERNINYGYYKVHDVELENNIFRYQWASSGASGGAALCRWRDGDECGAIDPTGTETCLTGSGSSSCCDEDWFVDTFTANHYDDTPGTPTVTAATAFDPDQDGIADLVVALKDGNTSWVVRSKLRPYYLGDVIWTSTTGERVVAMTSGDFDGDGTPELITATEDSSSNTRIHRGDGTALPWLAGGPNGLKNLGLGASGSDPIYGPTTGWDVLALTAGNYDTSSGEDELLTAFKRISTGMTYVYRGNGETSVTDLGIPYGPTGWTIKAMATADFGNTATGSHSGDGIDDVVTSFYSNGEDRVYAGNGLNSLTLRELMRSTTEHVTAMAAGELDGDGDADLITSLDSGTTRRVYRGNGWSLKIYTPNGVTGNGTEQKVYESSGWNVPLLVVHDFRGGSAAEVAAVFTNSSHIQIWAGDGTSAWNASPTGLTTYWKFYELDW